MFEMQDLRLEDRDLKMEEPTCDDCGSDKMRFTIEDNTESSWDVIVGCDECESTEKAGVVEPKDVRSLDDAVDKAREMAYDFATA